MRRIFVLAAVIALLFAMAVPALADKPESVGPISWTFTDENPCTNQDHDVTIVILVSEHQHNGRLVVHMQRSGSTSDGFTMVAGTQSWVDNGQVQRGRFVDQWRHDDGRKFKVHGGFVYNGNQGEVKIDSLRLDCIGSS